jgi:two-component system, OmpR family, response regulator
MAVIDQPKRRRHVLVVEDDALVSDVVVAALEDDFETSLVETSTAALECLSRGGIDLVLLDCTLPDGVHANLIPSADCSGVPIVLMSGDPQRIQDLCTEARPCIVKPFTLAGLLDVVHREIGRTTSIAA